MTCRQCSLQNVLRVIKSQDIIEQLAFEHGLPVKVVRDAINKTFLFMNHIEDETDYLNITVPYIGNYKFMLDNSYRLVRSYKEVIEHFNVEVTPQKMRRLFLNEKRLSMLRTLMKRPVFKKTFGLFKGKVSNTLCKNKMTLEQLEEFQNNFQCVKKDN